MKRIFLIRHAKSSWKDSSLRDIERPLKKKKKSDTVLIGGALREKYPRPDVFISSPAKRAKKTAKKIAKEIGYDGKILVLPELYDFDLHSYYSAIEQINDKYDSVFLFGHNPVISETAMDVTGEYFGEMPTCAVYVADIQTSKWSEVTPGCAVKVDYISPKMYK